MSGLGKTNGMRHVALYVVDLEKTESFYTELLGMEVEWRPDTDNVYLTSGNDNLALHRRPEAQSDEGQREDDANESVLDHIGFFINEKERISDWFTFLTDNGVKTLTEPRDHRDGARGFYCEDPSGTRVQLIYHPPIAKTD
ncbi:MAG TPA: glyoxalase [Gammaproteobacteria bacterium]|nr:glyoxalase [Gammaproteobacteria bacterium]|tara:strand:- start:3348 stop:3770 length:423 start_codon:yes stop_codon:yes gene_type:complete